MSAPATGAPAGHATGDVPVLMYHSIAVDAVPRFRRFAVHPDEFSAQMEYLAAEGYQPMTAADLVASWSAGRPASPRPVVLTFDDAFTDFYSTALPVLHRHGFRATLFTPTGYIGGEAGWLRSCNEAHRKVLSWQALRDIAAEGVEMAAHSHTHPQLDRLPAAIVRDELDRSRRLLEDNLGLLVEGFAYPFGYWNRTVRAAVAAAGFGYAFAVADLATAPADDVLLLPRLTVNAGVGVGGLARLLRARSTPIRRGAAATKRAAWRTLRRRVVSVGGDPREGWLA
jgi:peptidoglycan/xylan/chitin deacetylase (PgdA/CDA1 family)